LKEEPRTEPLCEEPSKPSHEEEPSSQEEELSSLKLPKTKTETALRRAIQQRTEGKGTIKWGTEQMGNRQMEAELAPP
jgi:hypothetical protein